MPGDHLEWPRGSRAQSRAGPSGCRSPKGQRGAPRCSSSQGWKGLSLAPDRAHAHAPRRRPLPVPPPLTIVTGAVGPRPAPARSERVSGRRWAAPPLGPAARASRVWGERRNTRPPLRPERRPPLCPSKTHTPRLTSEAGNQKPGRETSQKVGGTARAFGLCFGARLTGGLPPFKDTEYF